jgi:penicillin-binding protein 1A
MTKAVASRPAEEFETEVTLPNWQVEGGEGAWTGEPDDFLMVDPDGNPIPAEDGGQPLPSPDVAREPQRLPQSFPGDEPAEEEQLNQEWLDRVTRRNRPPPPPRDPPPPPRRSDEPADPVNRSPFAP